jgi:biopolymer transport protein ExbD
MGAKVGTGGGPMADINVTPLIDVVLVLLVVFMVITPMLQSGMPVDLPIATQTTTVKDVGQHIVVSITVNDACIEKDAFPCQEPAGWFVEQEQVDKDTIIEQIDLEYLKNAERSILIKADERLTYKQVREVTAILAERRMSTVLIAAKKGE